MNFGASIETREAGVEWLVLAHAIACAHGDPMLAAEAAKHARLPDRVCNILQRAGVGAISLSDPTSSALGDLRTLTTGFIESLRSVSLLDAVLGMCRQIAPRTLMGVVTLGASGSVLSESHFKPISKLAIDASGALEPRKVASIVIATQELLRFSPAAQSLFNTELRGAVALAQDADAIAQLITAVSSNPSTGRPDHDLFALFENVRITQLSRPLLATSPRVVAQLAMYRSDSGAVLYPDVVLPSGGSIAGVPLLGVDALANDGGSPAGDSFLLVDASQVAGDRGTLTLDTSQHSSLQLDDSPTASAANLVSMFQTDSAALRVERWYALQKLREDAVAVLSGVDYVETLFEGGSPQ